MGNNLNSPPSLKLFKLLNSLLILLLSFRKESGNWSLKIDEEIFEELYSIERRPFSPTNEIPNPTFEGVVILYSGKTFIVSGSIVSLND